MIILAEMKINIEKISDDRNYREVAFLVDRPDFLRDVIDLRGLIGLEDPIPHDEVVVWEAFPPKEAENYLTYLSVIERKYRKTGWGGVIAYAVLAGEVADKELKTYGFFSLGFALLDNETRREMGSPDSAGNIRRDRKWYWEWKERQDEIGICGKILVEWNQPHPEEEWIDDPNIVEQAISRYRKQLAVPI